MPFVSSFRGTFGPQSENKGVSNPTSGAEMDRLDPPLFAFSSATFTNGGAAGRFGPTLAQARSGVGNPTWASTYLNMNAGQGIQQWTVPATSRYRFEAAGARGGNGANGTNGTTGGQGARLRVDVALNQGDILNIVVGQEGGNSPGGSSRGGGGGGGTFVYSGSISGNGLIIAAGGGGGGDDLNNPGFGDSARSSLNPTTGGGSGNGGETTNDGQPGSSQGNPIGWLGVSNTGSGRDGTFFDGGNNIDNNGTAVGGFGGGGGDGDDGSSGAGFSGGDGTGGAGAGGSYYAGLSVTGGYTSIYGPTASNFAWLGTNNGHGYVVITRL